VFVQLKIIIKNIHNNLFHKKKKNESFMNVFIPFIVLCL